jgi:hypothetical protein
MSRWAAAWRDVSETTGSGDQKGECVRSVNSVTTLQTATEEIVMCAVRVSVGIEHRCGRITAISVPQATDPPRTTIAAMVNDWLARGDDLETQALRLVAMTDLVAGLIAWRMTAFKNDARAGPGE